MKKTVNKRKIQASETKNRIFEAAKKLFDENDFKEVAISDIVAAAGVSIGTFYLYFSSKDQIIAEIYVGEDSFYDRLLQDLTETAPDKRLLEYFDRSSARMEANGLAIVRQLYVTTNENVQRGKPKNFQFLVDTVLAGQDTGVFRTDIPAEEVVDFLLTLTSGIIFEWCLRNGTFSLNERTKNYITLSLDAFLN